MTGEDVRKLRKQLGLTQVELAAQLGVHEITVSKWETGVHKVPEPAAKLLQLLAKMAHSRGRR